MIPEIKRPSPPAEVAVGGGGGRAPAAAPASEAPLSWWGRWVATMAEKGLYWGIWIFYVFLLVVILAALVLRLVVNYKQKDDFRIPK